MWNQNHNNRVFPGQVMSPSLGSQSTHIGNMNVPALSDVRDKDFVSESSRKRKSMAMAQPGNDRSDGVSQLVPENCWPNKSYGQHKVGKFEGMNAQENGPRMFSNQTSLPAEYGMKEPQLGSHQFHSPNSFNSQLSEGTFPSVAAEKFNNLCSRMLPQSFNQNGQLTLLNSPAGKITTFPESQGQSDNIFSKIDASKLPIYPIPRNTAMEAAHLSHGLSDAAITGVLNGTSRAMDGRADIKDICKTEPALELKQSGQIIGVAAETTDFSRVGTGSLVPSACTGTNKSVQSCQLRANTPDNGAVDKGRDQSFGDHDIRIVEENKGSNMEDVNPPLGDEISPKNDLGQASHNLNGKSNSHLGKVPPATNEKLWDGPLQLNSSITVSAVAFFKSGEKAPEIKWSNSIEVKGKVRLEAFEKYIQELPRSRSRGLMVTSLCWKPGSSETGLTGMKEVAKGYKKGERVGFAELSTGIDLYVCPRSDTIITILAKYGFFKGMAAVEDDQDSLIGCVVWRRKCRSSDSNPKKDEKELEKPTNPSKLVIRETVDAIPPSEPGGDSSSLGSSKESTPPDNTGHNDGIVSRNVPSSEVQIDAGNSFTIINGKPTPSDANCPSTISVGLEPTHLSASTSRDSHIKSKAEMPIIQFSGLEKPGSGSELPRPVLPAPPQTIKMQSRPTLDDDDLPEFDFGTACGITQRPVSKSPFSSNSAHVADPAPLDKKLPAEGAKNVNGPMPSTVSIGHLMATAGQHRSQAPSFPVASTPTNFPVRPPKKLVEGELQLLPLPPPPPLPSGSQPPPLPSGPPPPHVTGKMAVTRSTEVSNQIGISNQATSTALCPPKSLWDDDDDMPEWLPPNMKNQNQPPPKTSTRTSISCVPSSLVSNTNLEKMPPGPPRPLPPPPPSPSSVPIHPPLPTQGLPNAHPRGPVSVTVMPVQARPVGGHAHIDPRPPVGLNSNSILRRPSNMYDVRPIRPPGWRGLRP